MSYRYGKKVKKKYYDFDKEETEAEYRKFSSKDMLRDSLDTLTTTLQDIEVLSNIVFEEIQNIEEVVSTLED